MVGEVWYEPGIPYPYSSQYRCSLRSHPYSFPYSIFLVPRPGATRPPVSCIVYSMYCCSLLNYVSIVTNYYVYQLFLFFQHRLVSLLKYPPAQFLHYDDVSRGLSSAISRPVGALVNSYDIMMSIGAR